MNKNDYKLTFEESGQWASGNLTTWGRIQSAEPLDDKSNSLPELNGTPRATATEPQRPSSLLATFVERQPDYEYSELYVGNGRYVDVNDNEIGFVPQSTAALQSADRWRAANRLPAHPPSKPRRTFADFHNTRAPQLDFMAMQHQVTFFRVIFYSTLSFYMRLKINGSASCLHPFALSVFTFALSFISSEDLLVSSVVIGPLKDSVRCHFTLFPLFKAVLFCTVPILSTINEYGNFAESIRTN